MSQPDTQNEGVGLLLSDDFLFGSKITATARSLGLTVKTARNVDALLGLRAPAPRCVVIDLANPGLDIAQLAHALRAVAPPPFLVAYGSHVDAATLKAARDAGCDVVLPRSKFVEELPTQLATWFRGGERLS